MWYRYVKTPHRVCGWHGCEAAVQGTLQDQNNQIRGHYCDKHGPPAAQIANDYGPDNPAPIFVR